MDTRNSSLKHYLASASLQSGKILGLCIILSAGCATQQQSDVLDYNPTAVGPLQCKANTVKYCKVRNFSRLNNSEQVAFCGCVNRIEYQRAVDSAMRRNLRY